MKVFKFGGASIRDAGHVRHLVDIVGKYVDEKILLVISAKGKTTNALEAVVDAFFLGDSEKSDGLLKHVVEDHLELAAALGVDREYATMISALEEHLMQMLRQENALDRDCFYDQVVSAGELMSTHLLHAVFQNRGLSSVWLDVREVLVTDATYREAKLDWKDTCRRINHMVPKLFDESHIIVTQGFIGRNADGMTTTLGREGSDYTAAIFSYCLDAREVTIWKDVTGILTADPGRFDNVDKIGKMTYREAIEMTYYGAKVIHPKTIQPLQRKSIVLNVRSFEDPAEEGTTISDLGELNYPPIVVIEDDQILLRISTNDFSFIAEDHLSNIFVLLNKYRIKMKMMRNAAVSFNICVTDPGKERLNQFIHELGTEFSVTMNTGLQLLTIRHFTDHLVENLTKQKLVLMEERLKNTIQMVTKPLPQIIEKS